jgi:hypothetical protein
MYSKSRLTNLLLVNVLALLFSFPAFSFQNPDGNNKEVEQITIYGQRTVFELKRDIKKKQRVFYRHFNQVNDRKKFDVLCKKQRRNSSHFSDQICEPRYIKTKRARTTSANGFAGDSNFSFARLPSLGQLKQSHYSDKDGFFGHMKKILDNNPDLAEEYIDLLNLTNAYEQKKLSRK